MKTRTQTFKKILFNTLIFSVLFMVSLSVSAQENQKPESPYFVVISSHPEVDQLPLKSTRADVSIAGVIADVIITQEYRNESLTPLEAIYTFPASTHAAIYGMEMLIGDRKIVARIEEKKKAREQYTEAKEAGKRTSLLEQQRPNVFQMNVANIMPGDVIKVTLKYTELLVPEAGTYKFVYPAVVGPRYTGESTAVASNAFTNTPYTKKGASPVFAFDMKLNLSTGMPIQNVASATHKIITSYPKPSVAQVGLSNEEINPGNRDFVLEYKLAGNTIESGLMLYEHGDENFFLLMVQPPKRVVREEVPPREYVFIVDVSGSMHGYPINTTKTLMRNLITNLRPIDRFNVLVFESGSYWLADESLPAKAENIEKATAFLDSQQGGGGTNLLDAMQKAMTFPRCEEGLSRSFVVVTDGYVDVEKEVFDLIRTKSDEANTFTFGIGTSVNRYIIEGMAHCGMAEPFIVLGPEGADKEAEKLRSYINNPVLTQIKKRFSGLDVYDVEPLSVPDLLADRPLIIYGKYRGKAQGTITIEGVAGKKKFSKSFDVSSVKPDKKHAALRYLWARKRVQMTDDYRQLSYNDQDNAQQKITDLGLKYNLMTAYTSFIAVEESVTNKANLKTVKQPLPLPENVENSAVGFELEVESDEPAFSYHKKIELPFDLQANTKQKIQASIEKKLMTEINELLDKNTVTLNSIEVVVDQSGNVAVIRVNGKDLSKEIIAEIEKLVQKQVYGQFKINRVWKYTIVF